MTSVGFEGDRVWKRGRSLEFILLVVLGLATGFISSLLGVGGGIVVIPSLLYLFPHFPPQALVGSCLFFIFINSFVNARSFWRLGIRPRGDILAPMAFFNVVGVVAAGLLTQSLEKDVVKLLFALVISLAALGMFWGRCKDGEDEGEGEGNPRRWKTSLSGLLGGLAAGAGGLGGGGVMMPLLIRVVKLPPKRVSLYSNCVMILGTFSGSMTFFLMETPPTFDDRLDFFQFGQVNVGLSFSILLGSLFTSPLGALVSQRIPTRPLVKLFAWLLLLIACRIYWEVDFYTLSYLQTPIDALL